MCLPVRYVRVHVRSGWSSVIAAPLCHVASVGLRSEHAIYNLQSNKPISMDSRSTHDAEQ